MSGKTPRRRWWKLVALLALVGALVAAVRPVLRSEWMRRQVEHKLHDVVIKALGASYSLEIGDVVIDPIRGDLAITNVVLDHDPATVDSLLGGDTRFLLSAHADRIAITDLSYWRLLLVDEIRVGTATVYAPALRYTYASHRDVDTTRTAATAEQEEGPELINIDELMITEGSGRAVDLAGRAPELVIDRLDVQARGIRVGLPHRGSAVRWKVGSAQVDVQNIVAQLPPYYDMTIAHIGLLHPEGLASIDSLRFIPRVERRTTHQHLREMTSIYSLEVKSIALARIDLYRAFARQQVEMGSLTVDGAFFDVFLDKTMPEDPSRFKPLPVSALRNVPFGLRVDTLRLTHAEMLYSERFDVEHGWGDTRLTGIEATILNVSNDTLLAIADTVMRGTVDAELFGKGALHADYAAPLASRNDAFKLDVTLRDMPLAAANSMSENLILLRADSGWISSLHFVMNANNDSAIGPFTLKYSGAWLRMVDSDGKKRGFLTKLVNSAVHHNSKDKPPDERTEHLRMARRKDRSLFNYIWIYTREGLMHTLLPEALADVQSGRMKRKAGANDSSKKKGR